MRELVIRFQTDGDWVPEIDENRSYFLSEAEEIIKMIQTRLSKEKRMIKPKSFCLMVEGKEILYSFVHFDNPLNKLLKEQIINAIHQYDLWELELKQKYINKIKEYAEKEQRLFVQSEFRMFTIRLEEVLQPNFSLDQTKFLFDQVYASITTSFFSQMEDVVLSVSESYLTILENISEGDKDWFEDEQNLHDFGQYILANYLSVSKSRLPAIQVQFDDYHILQDYLFIIKVEKHGFNRAMAIHENLQKRFRNEWNNILMQGFSLKTDDMVKSLLLAPIINKFFHEELENEDISNQEREYLQKILSLRDMEEKKDEGAYIS